MAQNIKYELVKDVVGREGSPSRKMGKNKEHEEW